MEEKERERMVGKTQMILVTTLVLLSILGAAPEAVAEVPKTSSSQQQIQVDMYLENTSLQEMINNAEPGATIQFPSGTYHEVLTINKPLQITGDESMRTIVRPTSSVNGYAIQIIAEGVILRNLDIMNQAEGLYTTGLKITAGDTTIENCVFHDTPIGIALWSSQNTISHCIFQGCDDEGIVLLGISSSACANNTITACSFSENCDGIELQYATHTQINSCDFNRNTHAGIDAIESNNDNNSISDCTFKDNSAFGLYLARSSQNLITQCAFSNDVLILVHATQNTLEKSQVKNIHLLQDSSLILDQCIDATTENIISEQSTYEIRTNHQEQTLVENTYIERYHQILSYILSHLKTLKTFYEQLSQARM
jgi:parallel beta-helix repeat protein